MLGSTRYAVVIDMQVLRTPPHMYAMYVYAVGVEVPKILRSKPDQYPYTPLSKLPEVAVSCVVSLSPLLLSRCRVIKIHHIQTVPLSLPTSLRPPLVLRTIPTTAMGPKLKQSKAFTGKIMQGRSSIFSYFSKVDTVSAVVM